jgi:ribosomal-protein-alanine N-acetyltransferase
MRAMEAQAATAAHWAQEDYQRLFVNPQRLALVIEEGHSILGFIVGNMIGPEWELENVAIAASAQRRGLATALLRQFLDSVAEQGGQAVFLEVRASNAAARALYARHGFVETGRRRSYYQDPPEDAVLYRKTISTP